MGLAPWGESKQDYSLFICLLRTTLQGNMAKQCLDSRAAVWGNIRISMQGWSSERKCSSSVPRLLPPWLLPCGLLPPWLLLCGLLLPWLLPPRLLPKPAPPTQLLPCELLLPWLLPKPAPPMLATPMLAPPMPAPPMPALQPPLHHERPLQTSICTCSALESHMLMIRKTRGSPGEPHRDEQKQIRGMQLCHGLAFSLYPSRDSNCVLFMQSSC